MLRFITDYLQPTVALYLISIHLMLRFIRINGNLVIIRFTFQYISCYGLSRKNLTSGEKIHHFNTSHVTVYPVEEVKKDKTNFHFNTSHVTVYLIMLAFKGFNENHFNTSHVTVYHQRHINKWLDNWISIHLMLRFIACVLADVCLSLYRFQYISCYGLSARKLLQPEK